MKFTITLPGKARAMEFRQTFILPFAPQNGLRISMGEAASFVVEGLTWHDDAGTFSCWTRIGAIKGQPMDDVLSYYAGIGYEVVV